MKKVLLLFICILFFSTKTNAQHGRLAINIGFGNGYNNYPQQQYYNYNQQQIVYRQPVEISRSEELKYTVLYTDVCGRYTGHGYKVYKVSIYFNNNTYTCLNENRFF